MSSSFIQIAPTSFGQYAEKFSAAGEVNVRLFCTKLYEHKHHLSPKFFARKASWRLIMDCSYSSKTYFHLQCEGIQDMPSWRYNAKAYLRIVSGRSDYVSPSSEITHSFCRESSEKAFNLELLSNSSFIHYLENGQFIIDLWLTVDVPSFSPTDLADHIGLIQDIASKEGVKLQHQGDFQLRLAELCGNEGLADFEIVVNNVVLPSSKLLLAANSDYFKAMFAHNNKETATKRVELQDISVETMKTIMTFVHSGELHLTSSNVAEVMQSASRFLMSHLQTRCHLRISEEIFKICDKTWEIETIHHRKVETLSEEIKFKHLNLQAIKLKFYTELKVLNGDFFKNQDEIRRKVSEHLEEVKDLVKDIDEQVNALRDAEEKHLEDLRTMDQDLKILTEFVHEHTESEA